MLEYAKSRRARIRGSNGTRRDASSPHTAARDEDARADESAMSAAERTPMLGARRDGAARGREAGESRRGRGRGAWVDQRRAFAALVSVVGVVLAVAARREDARARSAASDAMMGATGGGATGGARGNAREGVDAADYGARTFERASALDDARSASEKSGTVDFDALNERLSGSVWDFNEARPRTAAEKMAAATREARPLPALGQTTRGGSTNRDVAEGESRSSSYSKKSDTNRAGTLQPGLALTDEEIYDPAFVDDEYEHGKRSGRELVKRFLNPPMLNTTWDTGRLRRLGRTLYLDGKPWLMRAVCYSPVPVGWDPDWFEPYGDFFTNDYAGIFERDIPLMAAAGVNTMRIYT